MPMAATVRRLRLTVWQRIVCRLSYRTFVLKRTYGLRCTARRHYIGSVVSELEFDLVMSLGNPPIN